MLVCLCKIVNEHVENQFLESIFTAKINTLINLDELLMAVYFGSGGKNVFILPFVYVPFDLQLAKSCQIPSIWLTTLDHTLLGYTCKVDGSLNRI